VLAGGGGKLPDVGACVKNAGGISNGVGVGTVMYTEGAMVEVGEAVVVDGATVSFCPGG
jgi:hypothetical protein